jgi:hypothetical protein
MHTNNHKPQNAPTQESRSKKKRYAFPLGKWERENNHKMLQLRRVGARNSSNREEYETRENQKTKPKVKLP